MRTTEEVVVTYYPFLDKTKSLFLEKNRYLNPEGIIRWGFFSHWCVGGKTFNVWAIKHGAPQGSVLGPFPFWIYIVFLPIYIYISTYISCSMEAYMDETQLIHSSISDDVSVARTPPLFNEEVESLYSFSLLYTLAISRN